MFSRYLLGLNSSAQTRLSSSVSTGVIDRLSQTPCFQRCYRVRWHSEKPEPDGALLRGDSCLAAVGSGCARTAESVRYRLTFTCEAGAVLRLPIKAYYAPPQVP